MEIALIGAGFMGRIHLDGWMRAGVRVRVYDQDGDRAAALAGEFAASGPGVRVVGSLDAALDGVAAADVCTPTSTHRDLALTALARGIAVVLEKPVAADARETEEIAAAALAAGLPVYPAHGTRFLPAYAHLHGIVASGRLGTGVAARFTHDGYHPRPWPEPLTAQSGGILTDQLAHDIDVARWIFGDVVRVYAAYRGGLSAPAPAGSVAIGTVALTHAGGALSRVVGGWSAAQTPPRSTFHVTGTGAAVSFDSARPRELRVVGGTVAGMPRMFGESPFVAQIREFATALAGGPPARVTMADAVATMRIAEAAAQSAWTGRAIEFEGDGVLR